MTFKRTILFLMWCTFVSLQDDVDAVALTLYTPQHQRIKSGNDTADIQYVANGSLNRCQFNIWDGDDNEALSLYDSRNLTRQWTADASGWLRVRDFRTNLSRGLCGMSAQALINGGRYLVGCRVRVADQDWVYRYTMLYVTANADVASDLRIQPEDDVSVPSGSAVNITCTTSSRNGCVFTDRHEVRLTPWASRPGQPTCGATANITEHNRGVVWCRDNETDTRSAVLVATEPPNAPPELIWTKNQYRVGDTLEATCRVAASVPPANITWYIGDYVVAGVDVVRDAWRWSWMPERRTQILRRRLGEEDGGRNVTCVVTHHALDMPMYTSRMIVFGDDLQDAESSNRVLYIGVGVGIALALISLALIVAFNVRKCHRQASAPVVMTTDPKEGVLYDDVGAPEFEKLPRKPIKGSAPVVMTAKTKEDVLYDDIGAPEFEKKPIKAFTPVVMATELKEDVLYDDVGAPEFEKLPRQTFKASGKANQPQTRGCPDVPSDVEVPRPQEEAGYEPVDNNQYNYIDEPDDINQYDYIDVAQFRRAE